MDIKDSYLHGAIGVVKSISVNADKLTYKLADQANTPIEVTMSLATQSANGLLSSTDKIKLDNLSTTLGNYVTIDTDQTITGTKTFTKQLNFTATLGIAPFLVSSITKVANLNSDFLDGKHDLDFIIRSAASDLAYGDVLFHSLYNLGYSYKIETTNVKASLNTNTYSTSGWTEITNETDKLDYLKVFNRDRNSGVSLDSTKCGIRYTIQVAGYNQGEFLHILRGYYSKGLNWIVICEYLKVDSSGNVTSTHTAYNQKITWNDSEQAYIKCTLFGDYNRIRITFISADDIPALHVITLYNISLYTSRGGSQGVNLNHGFRYANLNSIIPYSNNKWYLGSSGYKWKGVYASNFYGNLNGQYINALTGYAKASSMSSIAASDSLNSALGKLEYKTDFIYNDIIGGENNANVIDKWSEIKDFIAEVGNSTDITDVFVTRKTALTVTGLKTFTDNIIINTTAPNKTPKLTLKEHYTGSSSWISEIVSDYYGKNVCTTENFTHGLYIILGRELFNNLNILDSTKTPIARISKEKGHWFDGTLTASGNVTAVKFITKDGTSAQFVKGDGSLDSNTYALSSSLGNYVTLTTTQTISGSKTFTSTLTTRSINPLSNNTYSLGTSDKKWASLYSTNIYSNAIYNGSSIYASGNEIIHGGSDYFELNKGYPNAIMGLNASEYKFKLGSDGVQFMIAANGNVGIGDVGGAPAYKLHVGGGEIMADTVHAWSGGFKKNGSSDSYVLLGGGGHKALTALFTSLTSNSTNAISITIGGTTKTITKSTLASSLGLGSNAYTSTAYLPLAGGQMNAGAYISWNTGENGNDVSDWSTITGNGLRVISSTSATSKAPKQYSTALHVRGRYGFLLASEGGATAKSFYIANIHNKKETGELNWFLLLHSSNYSSYLPLLNSASTHATKDSVIYAPTSAGTQGNILVSNGSGAPTWSTLSALGNLPNIAYNCQNGYLVKTNILADSNTMITFRIEGNGYSAGRSILTTGNFYNYTAQNNIWNASAYHHGLNFGNITVFCYNNLVYLWFSHTAQFQSFIVTVYGTNDGNQTNRVTKITDEAIPTSGVSRKIVITPRLDHSEQQVSKTITSASAGWYRIARSEQNIVNCEGTFEILGTLSGYHTSAKIVSGTSYGANVSLSVIDCHNWTNATLTKVRIVYNTTWSGNYAYLEVYKVALKNVTISVKSVNGFGWTLIDPIVGSVPSGYSTLERNLTSNVLQTDNILAISASFNGSVTLTGTTADTSVLKFSREGANTCNYILWPGNTNRDCKLAFGYSNSSAGVYYYMSSGALYPAANNTYDLGTTTNAWKTMYGTVTNVAGESGTVNASRHVWFSDSSIETKRNYDDDFKYNPSTNLLTVGSISGSAAQLTTTEIVSKKFTSLTNASWTDTGCTFTELESGTYAILVTSTNLVASGIMSVYKNIQDSVGDEIPLHVYGTAGWRPYLRTNANKLLISSNDVKAATNGRTVTIKIAKIL